MTRIIGFVFLFVSQKYFPGTEIEDTATNQPDPDTLDIGGNCDLTSQKEGGFDVDVNNLQHRWRNSFTVI